MATKEKTSKKATSTPGQILAYCMKTKEKNVPMQDAVIDINNGRYIAKGHDGNDNKMTCIMSEAKALEAIENGFAQKGQGWSKVAAKKK